MKTFIVYDLDSQMPSCHACTIPRSFRAYLFANSNGHL